MRRLVLASLALAGCSNFNDLDRGYGADMTATAHDLARVDDSTPFDMEPDSGPSASCADQVKDGDESDVDCGGSCAPCDVGRACNADRDCQTTTCIDGTCELASGPPSWVPVGQAGTGNGMPMSRLSGGAGVGMDGSIYVFGGVDGNNNASSVVEKLGVDGSWASASGMSETRAGFAYGSYNGTLLAVNGSSQANPTGGNGSYYTSFDRSTGGNWTQTNNSVDKRIGGAGAFGLDGRFYSFGGYDGSAAVASGGSWVPTDTGTVGIAPLNTARFVHAASVGSDGRLYAIGGANTTTGTLASVEAYASVPNAWTYVSPLPVPIDFAGAALAPDGRIYLPGGYSVELGIVQHGAYAYRPGTTTTTDAWVQVADMAGPRYRHAVTVGADGRVYAIGGQNLIGYLRTVEAYGPSIQLDVGVGSQGTTIHVTGSNFAANATVTFNIGGSNSTSTGTTDAMGNLASTAVVVPANATDGATRFIATDSRSRYPASISFNVSM